MAILSESAHVSKDEINNNLNDQQMDRLFMEKFGSRINSNGEIRLPDPSMAGVYEIQVLMPSNESILYTVDLRQGRLVRGQLPSKNCDCRIQVSANDLLRLLNGQLDFAQGFLQGKLRLGYGNQASAFKFMHLLIDIASSTSTTSSTTTPNNPNLKYQDDDKVSMIPTDGLKSDVIFSIIQHRLSSEPELVKKMPFIIEINLTRNGHLIATWVLDTKTEGGRIYRSHSKNNGSTNSDNKIKPDAVITIDDNDLAAIMLGNSNPQRVFISGRMKIRGNIMLLQRLNQFWAKIQATRRGSDFRFVKQLLTDNQFESGLASEMVFFNWISRLVKPSSELVDCTIHVIITAKGEKQTEWVISYDSNNQLSIKRRRIVGPDDHSNHANQSRSIMLEMDDQDFCRLVQSSDVILIQAIEEQRVRVTGDHRLLSAVSKLFDRIADNEQTPAVNLKAKL
ncbi:uncharacterized protein LOC113799454 [Dermatophagoides pteronyssinus]|uniref:uncharacterized protein LOC113799454 n=1 Tax=Dermatophagoides pteronyssinus TaxID=6956 RepID=UPI003F66A1C7